MSHFKRTTVTLAALIGLLHPPLTWAAPAAQPSLQPGLRLSYTATTGDEPTIEDLSLRSSIQLYVPEHQPPTPFLPPAPFTAEWTGFVSVDLRSDLWFQVQPQGRFQLEINGEPVLNHPGDGSPAKLSKPVRLNKGPNVLKATLHSPATGATSVRLLWGEHKILLVPVPPDSFSHDPAIETGALAEARRRLEGRELALEFRCFKCHSPGVHNGVPELAMDAPTFEGIGNRRQTGWMARWIQDPSALRASARMPNLLHGSGTDDDAQAIASYLGTLTTGGDKGLEKTASTAALEPAHESQAAESQLGPRPDTLFEALHCQACHSLNPPPSGLPKPGIIPLHLVAEKFAPGKLEEFLRQPDAHYRWTRMPQFRFTPGEAKELATHLIAATEANPVTNTSSNARAGSSEVAVVNRGRALVQTTGCLNCHELNLDNNHSAPSFAALKRWDKGCLADAPDPQTTAPTFGLTPDQRLAIRSFAAHGMSSVQRHVASEFAERQARRLQCAACHGQFDGFPPFPRLGEQLTPEWMARYLTGELPYRPRPWLYSRMPGFNLHAKPLAQGLAMSHGFPPETPAEPPIDTAMADIGRQLVGKDNGFSCVSCHGVGTLKAMEVFEAEGINLSHAADRLQQSYYQRWLLNPTSIDLQTKMPVYFDQGLSPLTEVLDGDAQKQIEAMWHYFRQKDQMIPPNSGDTP